MQGKSALVSGSTAGIGFAVAQALAQEGASTIINGRSQARSRIFSECTTHSLIQRFATNEEVASLVVYLSSPLASATTGAALRVDGGVVRAIV